MELWSEQSQSFPESLFQVLCSPIMIGITVIFMFSSFLSPLVRSKYLYSFFAFLLIPKSGLDLSALLKFSHYHHHFFFSMNNELYLLRCSKALTILYRRGRPSPKMSVFGMTLTSGECRVHLRCHYSQVHSYS